MNPLSTLGGYTKVGLFLLLLCLPFQLLASGVNAERRQTERLRELADVYLAAYLEVDPVSGYFSGLEMDRHDLFLENDPNAMAGFERLQDQMLLELQKLDVETWHSTAPQIFHAKFLESLEADVHARVCRSELWNLDHMFGAHLLASMVMERQPLEGAEEESAALARLNHIGDYFHQEIDNLEEGLRSGYTMPKGVASRVLVQVRELVDAEAAAHPYLPDAQGLSEDFLTLSQKTIEGKIKPALHEYAQFLEHTYIPATRSDRAISANRNGEACYQALYRRWTSISRSPAEVHDIGLREVKANEAAIIELGKRVLGATDTAEILSMVTGAKASRFQSAAEYSEALQRIVQRSREKSASAFNALPSAVLTVSPLPEHVQGTGISAHYLSASGDTPAKFVYDPQTWDTSLVAEAEILAVHEGYPGHHLQIGLAGQNEAFHPLEKLFRNSAYVEGWARYAEGLAEELDIYQDPWVPIQRRAWPARGMVLDTGLHVLGWSDAELIEFLAASGRSDMLADPEKLLDRMAMMPAQLTAYDSGALEIRTLRASAETRLGSAFKLTEFHDIVLRDGAVPMSVLQHRVETYLRHGESGKEL